MCHCPKRFSFIHLFSFTVEYRQLWSDSILFKNWDLIKYCGFRMILRIGIGYEILGGHDLNSEAGLHLRWPLRKSYYAKFNANVLKIHQKSRSMRQKKVLWHHLNNKVILDSFKRSESELQILESKLVNSWARFNIYEKIFVSDVKIIFSSKISTIQFSVKNF